MTGHPNRRPDPHLLGGLKGMISLVVVVIAGGLLWLAFGSYFRSCTPTRGEVFRMPEDATRFHTSLVDSQGIHVATGLIYAPGIDAVQRQCLGCHSPKLITQFRATREGWAGVIKWMQQTQGLWDLGEDERRILDYLSGHYAPEQMGRRPNLDIDHIEWYSWEEGIESNITH